MKEGDWIVNPANSFKEEDALSISSAHRKLNKISIELKEVDRTGGY
jgi:hypothetical protein